MTSNAADPLALTEKDYELLMEAIGAWEARPYSDMLSKAVINGMLGKGSEEDHRRLTQDAEDQGRSRKSLTIVLKAKLEIARQKLQAESIEAAKGVEG
ncbi:MAG TPA: hypothetical protein VF614_00980 [Chthoniobacteraceae bacterium]|jgi:hypothetical protein